MSWIAAVIMGLVQGIAEFLPISSSGHLAIAGELLGAATEIPEFFDVLLHLGTLIAVFIFYWGDILDMIREFIAGVQDLAHHKTPVPVPPARRLVLLLIVATLPLGLVLPIKDHIERMSGNMYFVALALIMTGCLLFLSDRVRKGRKNERTASMLDALLIGFAQAFATCPGISRSGTTITAGCLVGFDRRFAVRFSFLMSIPAVLGANLLGLLDVMKAGVNWLEVPVYLLGVAVAAVSGYACLRLLKLIAEKGRFGWFAYYCWGVGLVTILLTFIMS